MEVVIIIGIILIILGIIGIIYAIKYNKIIISRLKTNEAEVNIDNFLRTKFDNIIKCINIIERKAKIEVKTFDEIKKLKSDKISSFELDRLLSKGFDEITIIAEDYPKVKETKGFNEIIKEINNNEEHLVALRSYYNKYCFEFNKQIKIFPNTIIAKIHKFVEKPFYDGKNLNDEIYNDFKI